MALSRIDLCDLRSPQAIAAALHIQLGQVATPVPIEDIARELGILQIRTQSFDGFEGMLLTDQVRSRGSILANTARGQRRARFTIAHELGHFLMEWHLSSDAGGFRCRAQDMHETGEVRQDQRQEIQANRFAIEILAPPNLMNPILSSDPNLRDAQRLRDRLDVSLEACLRRMIEIREEPLGAIWSTHGLVRYSVRGSNFPWITLKKGDRLPGTSDAHRTTKNATRGFTEITETSSVAWTDQPDLEIYEQTRVGNNGHAVTLLWAEIPDKDTDDDGLQELGMPQFR